MVVITGRAGRSLRRFIRRPGLPRGECRPVYDRSHLAIIQDLAFERSAHQLCSHRSAVVVLQHLLACIASISLLEHSRSSLDVHGQSRHHTFLWRLAFYMGTHCRPWLGTTLQHSKQDYKRSVCRLCVLLHHYRDHLRKC
jgi:hypothetical protein